MVLPNFIVIGAQRSGTTWLDIQLRHHPQIYLPARRKEIHFFDKYYDRGLNWYEGFFPQKAEQEQYLAIGEITPKYLYDDLVAKRIHSHLPNCKLLTILRNPVDRAYSQYGLAVRDRAESRSFEDFYKNNKDVLERGLYSQQLNEYLKLFKRESILVLIFEEVISRPEQAHSQIAKFLEVNPLLFDNIAKTKFKANSSYSVKFSKVYALTKSISAWLREHDIDRPVNWVKNMGFRDFFGAKTPLGKMNTQTRQSLFEYYNKDIYKLESILERDLSIWIPKANKSATTISRNGSLNSD